VDQLLWDEEFGLKFIEDHADEVLKSDAIVKLPADRFAVILKSNKLKADELTIYKALVKWGEAKVKESGDKTDLKTVAKDLIKYIRFPLMSINDFATVVAPSNLIESTQLVGLFSYLYITDEKVRALLPNPGFETKEREGFPQFKPWNWNPLRIGTQITLSNNNLTATKSSSGWDGGIVLGTQEFKGGDQYWEVKIGNISQMVGVASPLASTSGQLLQQSLHGALIYVGSLYGNLGTKAHLDSQPSYAINDVVGIHLAWNKTNKTYDMSWYKNRIFMAIIFRNIPIPVIGALELHSGSQTLDTTAKKPK